MVTSSLDILYLAIAISVVMLSVFICVNLVFTTLILRDVSKTTEKVRDTAEKINDFVVGPLHIIKNMSEYIKTVANHFGHKEEKKK